MSNQDSIIWTCHDAEILEFHLKRWPEKVSLVVDAYRQNVKPYRQKHYLDLDQPGSISAIVRALGDLYKISVIDENIEQMRQLEFGRYRIIFEGEDGPISTLNCDSFSHYDAAS